MNVSAIVSNLNGLTFLPRLLETLRAQEGVNVEIIVVDRESTDGSRDFLATASGVRVVTERAASGLVAGYHAGRRHASHDLLFFCNEDMWLDSQCLAKLARHVSVDTRIAAADPWQWSYDGARWIHGGTRFHKARYARTSSYPPRAQDFTVPLGSGDPIPFACAGAVLIHRTAYDEIGGWDTTFFLDSEDVDFFLRAWQHGWRCVVEPDAKVYHAVGNSNPQATPAGVRVSSKRYVAGRSNQAVVGLKHFTGTALIWAALTQFLPMGASLVRLRIGQLRAEWQALQTTIARLPDIMRFRRLNRSWRTTRPGQAFYREPHFQTPDRRAGKL